MDSSEVDPEEGFSFIWTIQNYSYCFQNSEENELKSPIFRLKVNNSMKWWMTMHPKRTFDCENIEFRLQKKYDCFNRTTLTVELSIFVDRDTYKKVFDKKLESFKVFSTKELKINKEEFNTYLKNDSLAIRCRIRKSNDKVLASQQCYARTIIGVERTTNNWMLTDFMDFENLKSITKKLFISNDMPCFTIVFTNTKETFAENKIEIEIKQTEQRKCFSTCEISLIDANDKIAHSVRSECRFDPSCERVWKFPFIQESKLLNNRNLYLPNGILSLRCEFAVSSGVICNQVEKTEYGKPNDSHLDSCYQTTPSDSTRSLENSLQGKDTNLPGSWKNDLHRFYTEGKFSDFTIRTTKKDFKVHKTILCARSEVFSAMFERDMKESHTGVVEIEDIEEDTVSKMLLFVYTDSVGEDLEWGTASTLYFAADKYGIVALKRKCSDFLKDNLTAANVCEVLVLADMHRDPELKSAAQDFIFEHSGEIMDSEEWKELMEDHLQLASETMHSFFRNLKV